MNAPTVFPFVLVLCMFAIAGEATRAQEPASSGKIALCEVVDEAGENTVLMPFKGEPDREGIHVVSTPLITEKHVEKAAVQDDERGARLLVDMTEEGAAILEKETRRLQRRRLAILVNGELVNAPVIQEPFSDSFAISGSFTREELEKLARQFNARAGKSPAP